MFTFFHPNNNLMLLFLILIQGALGVTVHSNTETFGSEYSKIVRIDRVGPDPKSHIKVAKFMEPLDSMLVPEKFLLAPTNAFSINLTCEEYGVEATVCDKARATLASAASRIAQELAISTQITVTARFRPFCSNNINCQNSKRLGSARHASSFVVKQDGQHFTYNQALVKQLGTRVKVQYSATDIRIKLLI